MPPILLVDCIHLVIAAAGVCSRWLLFCWLLPRPNILNIGLSCCLAFSCCCCFGRGCCCFGCGCCCCWRRHGCRRIALHRISSENAQAHCLRHRVLICCCCFGCGCCCCWCGCGRRRIAPHRINSRNAHAHCFRHRGLIWCFLSVGRYGGGSDQFRGLPPFGRDLRPQSAAEPAFAGLHDSVDPPLLAEAYVQTIRSPNLESVIVLGILVRLRCRAQ